MDLGEDLRLKKAATAAAVGKSEAGSHPSQGLNGCNSLTCTKMATMPMSESRIAPREVQSRLVVEFAMKRETNENGSTTVTAAVRVTYPWSLPACSAAHASEEESFRRLLSDTCGAAPEAEQHRRRRGLPICNALIAAAHKVCSTVSARCFMTDFYSAEANGLIFATPCYNGISTLSSLGKLRPSLNASSRTNNLSIRLNRTTRFYRIRAPAVLAAIHSQVCTYKYVHGYIKIHTTIGMKTYDGDYCDRPR
jgi:hypothetical protein